MAAAKLLEMRRATVYRGSTRVFRALDLDIGGGENTAVLGPNGAGKTTLLRLISRELYPVYRPQSYVRVLGRESWNVTELRAQLGIVSQELQLQYQREVRGIDVVVSGFFSSIGIHRHQRPSAEQHSRALDVLTELGAGHLRDRPISAMSAGEQRRCLLARALVHDPHTLVLDEPTASLDLRASFELLSLLRNLARAGKTLVLVTHHIQEIPPEVTRVILLKGGEVMAQGDKKSVLSAANLSALFDVPVGIVERGGFYQPFPSGS